MFCSTIIPTIGRPSVARAVKSVLDQAFTDDELEVVVVNDSGHPLAPAGWQQDERVSVVQTNKRERSVARNTGAAVARGEYFIFLDDDDWLLPGALANFWTLAEERKSAVWLYGGLRIVDGTDACLAEANSGLNGDCFAQVMGGAWIPLQPSLISADAFFEVGGFDSDYSVIEDQDLCRKISLIGEFANTPACVACLLRGDTWSTSTNYLQGVAETQHSRGKALDQPRALRHLISSADSPYWNGRNVRICLSTVRPNLRERRYLTALNRLSMAFACGLWAGRSIATRSFWQAMRADHVPGSLHYIMLANSTEEEVELLPA